MGKFNKELCKKCKFHGYMGHNGPSQEIACFRNLFKHESCKDRYGNDKRGDDPDNCLLFEAGKKLRHQMRTPDWTNWNKDGYHEKGKRWK